MDIGPLGGILPVAASQSEPTAIEVAAVTRVENPARPRRYSAAPTRVAARQDDGLAENAEESAEDSRDDRPEHNINLFA